MTASWRKSGLARLLVIGALLLRVAIPTGYMPASIAGGWYLQWCPHGVSDEFMAAMFEGDSSPTNIADQHQHQHQHHHHHRVAAGHHGGPEALPDSDGTSGARQCDFGVSAGDLITASAPPAAFSPAGVPILLQPPVRWFVDTRPRAAYRSRAPPHLRLS